MRISQNIYIMNYKFFPTKLIKVAIVYLLLTSMNDGRSLQECQIKFSDCLKISGNKNGLHVIIYQLGSSTIVCATG